MTVWSSSGRWKSDLWLILEVVTDALFSWSCDHNLGTLHLVHIYNFCSILWSHYNLQPTNFWQAKLIRLLGFASWPWDSLNKHSKMIIKSGLVTWWLTFWPCVGPHFRQMAYWEPYIKTAYFLYGQKLTVALKYSSLFFCVQLRIAYVNLIGVNFKDGTEI